MIINLRSKAQYRDQVADEIDLALELIERRAQLDCGKAPYGFECVQMEVDFKDIDSVVTRSENLKEKIFKLFPDLELSVDKTSNFSVSGSIREREVIDAKISINGSYDPLADLSMEELVFPCLDDIEDAAHFELHGHGTIYQFWLSEDEAELLHVSDIIRDYASYVPWNIYEPASEVFQKVRVEMNQIVDDYIEKSRADFDRLTSFLTQLKVEIGLFTTASLIALGSALKDLYKHIDNDESSLLTFAVASGVSVAFAGLAYSAVKNLKHFTRAHEKFLYLLEQVDSGD